MEVSVENDGLAVTSLSFKGCIVIETDVEIKLPTRCNRGFYKTGHITLSSTLDQQLENHSTKYHRQQPLYNTHELLMMGIVVPETC